MDEQLKNAVCGRCGRLFRKKIRVDHIDTQQNNPITGSENWHTKVMHWSTFWRQPVGYMLWLGMEVSKPCNNACYQNSLLSLTKVSAVEVTNAISRMLTGEKRLKIGLGENLPRIKSDIIYMLKGGWHRATPNVHGRFKKDFSKNRHLFLLSTLLTL